MMGPMAPASSAETRSVILDVAQRLIQSRGFSAISYADIAEDVGIRKASIHHHFPTKGDLGTALMARYRITFREELARIAERKGRARTKLTAYAKLFANVLRDDHRMCMCGMLAADFEALPKSLREEVRGFFEDNEEWISGVLARGREEGDLSFSGPPRRMAGVILSAFEGAMLVARALGDVGRFESVAGQLFADLGG
jgi:TetR/AcrR family transcriptional repressor of nem operon